MIKTKHEVPESQMACPFCETEGKIVRVIPYGSQKTEEQIKIECPECLHSWLYHTDE